MEKPIDQVFAERTWGWQTPPSYGVAGKRRYAMVIDIRKCTGCASCVMACKSEFDVPLSVNRIWLKVIEKGKYPYVRRYVIPKLCNQCDNPVCVRNCPTNATFKHEDGFVLQRYNQCIGCRACMIACPYNARHLLPRERTDLNKPTSVVDKCDFCVHRVSRGKLPACVTNCPTDALNFGDINDPDSTVAKLVAKNNVRTLKAELGTQPQVYYIGLDQTISDEVFSYLHRSDQLKEDFNEFKRYAEPLLGDIAEGESATKWIFKNLGGLLKEFPSKFGRVVKVTFNAFWRGL